RLGGLPLPVAADARQHRHGLGQPVAPCVAAPSPRREGGLARVCRAVLRGTLFSTARGLRGHRAAAPDGAAAPEAPAGAAAAEDVSGWITGFEPSGSPAIAVRKSEAYWSISSSRAFSPPAPARVPAALGSGSRTVFWVARYCAAGYIRLSRICWESLRSSGPTRRRLPASTTSRTLYFWHTSRSRATDTTRRASGGMGP